MQSGSEKDQNKQLHITSGAPAVLAPPIEAPTSPRTRLRSYSELLRPLVLHCLQAINALRNDSDSSMRESSAKAYYHLCELHEQETNLVTSKDVVTALSLLRNLFRLEGATAKEHRFALEAFFCSFLFTLEGSQPSAVRLSEVLRLSKSSPVLNAHALVSQRVAHCLRKACLALLSCQPELAHAYLEFSYGDAKHLCTAKSQYLNETMLESIESTSLDIASRSIRPIHCRKRGHALRECLKPFIDYAEEVAAQQRRMGTSLH